MEDKRFTKIIAMLLAIVMTLSVVTITAFADEATEGWTADVVVYNIGAGEVSVGVAGMETDYYFDENGNFAIVLEEEVVFPIEVEFQWGFERGVRVFETEVSVVEVGGHVFRVVAPAGITPVSLMAADKVFISPNNPNISSVVFGNLSFCPSESFAFTLSQSVLLYNKPSTPSAQGTEYCLLLL